MKQLLVVTLNSDEAKDRVLIALAKESINAYVMPSIEAKNSVLHNTVEPVPEFGLFRHLIQCESDTSATVVVIVDSEDIEDLKNLIKTSVSDTPKDVMGRMFALNLSFFEETLG